MAISFDDFKKKLEQGRTNQTSGGEESSRMPSFEEFKSNLDKSYSAFEETKRQNAAASAQEDIVSRLNTILTKSNSMTDQFNSRYSSKYTPGDVPDTSPGSSYRADTGDWLKSVTAYAGDYTTEYNDIRNLLNQYGDYYDSEWVKDVISALDSGKNANDQMLRASREDHKYWSQWDSKDAYAQWQIDNKEEQKKLNYDVEGGRAELEKIKELSGQRDRLTFQLEQNPAVKNDTAAQNRVQKMIDDIDAQLKEYGVNGENVSEYITTQNKYIMDAERKQTAYKWANDATTAEDFEEYSKKGASIQNPTRKEAEGWATVFGKVIGGKDIGNIVTYSRDNWEIIRSDELDGGQVQGRSLYHYMTDDEVDIYNYYLAKDGEDKANQYLDSLEETLNSRAASDYADKVEGNLALQYIAAASSGLAQSAEGLRNLFNFKDDYIETTQSQFVSQYIREDLAETGAKLPKWMGGSSLGQVGFDLINTGANMIPSIVISAGTGSPLLGAVVLGASASGNAYQEMLNNGYDKVQARTYSMLVGAAETGVSYALSGISALGGKITGQVISKAIDGIDNGLARFAIQFGGEMLSEGLEESIQEILDPVFKKLATGEDIEKIDWSEVVYSGLLGALSAGVMNGAGAVINAPSEIIANREAKSAYGDVESSRGLVESGLESAEGTESRKLAERYQSKLDDGKSLTGSQIRRLVSANESAMMSEDVSTITKAAEERLTALGETGNVSEISKVLAKQASGETLTGSERAVIKNSKYGQRVSNELNSDNIKKGQTSSEWARNIGTNTINADVYNSVEENEKPTVRMTTAADRATRAPKAKQYAVTKPTQTTEAIDTETNAEADADTEQPVGSYQISTNKEIEVKNVARKEGDTLILNTSVGEVNAEDISFGSESDAVLYGVLAMTDMSAEDINAVVASYSAGNGVSPSAYANGMALGWIYGYINYADSYVHGGTDYASLTDSQKAFARKLGADARLLRDSTKKMAAAPTEKTADDKEGKRKVGKVVNDTGHEINRSKLNDAQKSGLEMAEVLAEFAGGNIHIYESVVNDKGKRVFSMNIGEMKAGAKAPNGFYDHATGDIYIDINAGNSAEGTMVYTLSHEYVHMIRQWSPEKFNALADFLVEQYGEKGVSVEALIQRQIDKAKRNGRNITFDQAYEEMVADAMETMLTDKTVAEKIQSLKQKDKGLVNKLKQLFKKLIDAFDKVINAYKNKNPNSVEANEVLQFSTAARQRLAELYAEAFVDATESYQIGAKNLSDYAEAKTTDGADLLPQYRAMEADEEIYRQMLVNHGGMTDAEIDSLFETVDEALEKVKGNLEALDYAWEADIDDRAFNPVKPNSDHLYKVSMDFSTLCRKRILQQMVQERLQAALDTALTREDAIIIRNELMQIQEEGRQIEIACALCYVESARMKSPEQINKFLNNREDVLKEFFAGTDAGTMKQKLADAETAKRAELAERLDDPEIPNMSLKAIKSKYGGKTAQEIRDAKKEAKRGYTPTAEEQKLIDAANSMSITDFTSPAGLENLAKQYPRIFDAYTSFVRNATKSKGIENDTWWRAGDSDSIGDTLIANMNRENGLRTQSWSDFQVIHLLDYIAATIEMSTKNAKMQSYTKVPDFVNLMGNTGLMINMSLIPSREFNGKLEYDSVEGIDYKESLKLRDKYPATAGTICIGVNDDQIRLLLADKNIDYVIPYHKSGMAASIRKLMHIPTWSEYESYQNEAKLSRADAERYAKENGVTLTTDEKLYQVTPNFSDWFDLTEAQQIAKMENANPSNAAEQKKLGVMYGAYKAMQNAANNYKRVCAERGLTPKFEQFLNEDNYWKLLIDRKMVNNATGEIIEQKAVKPTFDRNEVMRILDDEVKRYGTVKADQDYAVREVTRRFLSKDFKSKYNQNAEVSERVEKALKDSADRVTEVNIIASSGDVSYDMGADYSLSDNTKPTNSKDYGFSDRDSEYDEQKIQTARRTYGIIDSMVYDVAEGNVVSTKYERKEKVGEKYVTVGRGVADKITIPKNDSTTELLVIHLPSARVQWLDSDETHCTILSNGRIAVDERTGNGYNYRAKVRAMVGNEIAILGGVREDGVFYRATSNKKDVDYIRKGTVRPSINHSTGGKEAGLSVWEIPKYFDQYFVKLTGDVVDIGSDGEPLLDVKTVKLVSADNVYGEFLEKMKKGREIFEEKYNWTDEQINAALSGNFSLQKGQPMHQDRDSSSLDNRTLLSNALDTVAQNPAEQAILSEYKSKLQELNTMSQELSKQRQLVADSIRGKSVLSADEMTKARNRIETLSKKVTKADKALLKIEAMKPIQEVLAREREVAAQKARAEGQESLRAAREKAKEREANLVEKSRTSRKEGIAKVRETRDRNDAQKKLQKLVLETSKWISSPSKDDIKVPDILKAPYAEFLESIDLSSKRLLAGGEPTQNDLRVGSAMDSLATAVEKIRNAQNPNSTSDESFDSGYLDLPENFIENLRAAAENIKKMMVGGDYVVNRMSASDIKRLSQMIRTLNHAIKEMSTLYSNLRFANVQEVGYNTMTYIDGLGEHGDFTNSFTDFIKWDNTVPYYAFKRFGKGGESIFEELMDAQDKLAFLSDEIFKFKGRTWTEKEVKEWSNDAHELSLPSGKTIKLTSADAMSIYCTSRREQGMQHLLGGGVRIVGLQKGMKKAQDSRSTLTLEDIQTICASLTDRQLTVAKAIQSFMSTVCAEWGNEISMKRFLTRMFTETYYFPLESNDENMDTKDPTAQQSDLYRLLNISATKALIKGANNEVIIRNIFDVFASHTSDMAKLNAFGMALLDYMKWINYREKTTSPNGQITVRGVRKSMEKAYGEGAKKYVINLIKDINGRGNTGADPKFSMKMVRAAKTASVGANLRVAFLQTTALPRARVVLSAASIIKGLFKMPSIKKPQKYCGIALWKSFGFFDTNITRSVEEQIKGNTGVLEKIISASMKGAEIGDAVTWGYLWNACEYEVAKTTKNKVGSEEFNYEVGKKLREVVYASQVVDSTLTRSQIMRAKGGMTQMVTAFMSEPTLSYNILLDSYMQFNSEKRRTGSAKAALQTTGKYILRAVATYMFGQLAAALAEGLFDAFRDDDDEEFVDKFIENTAQNAVSDLNPLNKIPIISDVAKLIEDKLGVGYFSSNRLDTQYLTTISNAYDAWAEIITKGLDDSSKNLYYAIYNTTKALSQVTGMPISNAMREVVTVWNNTVGAADSTMKIRSYDLSNSAQGENIYKAVVSGDTDKIEKLKAEFDDEESATSYLKSAIRDHYTSGDIDAATAMKYLTEHCGMDADGAYWQIDRWNTAEDEDYAKYDDFYEAVETGKNLKTVIKEYTSHGVSEKTLASQITSYFKPKYIEMSKSQRASLKGYLINAYEQLGYDRDKKSKDIDKWVE